MGCFGKKKMAELMCAQENTTFPDCQRLDVFSGMESRKKLFLSSNPGKM